MHIPGTVPRHVDSIDWQDYRGAEKGMVVYYNTDPVSEIPIREVPEDYPSDIVADPNYETGTYGLYGCSRPKIRGHFFKSKLRYLFFMTKYAGTNVEYMDQLAITGYYRITKSADVQKLHVRYLSEYGCLTDDTCMAFRSDEVRMVPLKEAFVITPDVLDEWGYSSRVTRQTRIMLDEGATAKLLEYLRSKTDATAEYIDETKRLSPATGEEEDEQEEEELAVEQPAETDDGETMVAETEAEATGEAGEAVEEVAEDTEPAPEHDVRGVGPDDQAATQGAAPAEEESPNLGETVLMGAVTGGEESLEPDTAAVEEYREDIVKEEVVAVGEEPAGSAVSGGEGPETVGGPEQNEVGFEAGDSPYEAPEEAQDVEQREEAGEDEPDSQSPQPAPAESGGEEVRE